MRQGVGLGEDDVPVLGELVVLDAEQVVEHGRDAVQDSLALGEDELGRIDAALASLQVQGERYPAHLAARAGR